MYLFLSLSPLFELLLFAGGGTLFLGENICKLPYSLSLTDHLLKCPCHTGAIFCHCSFKLISCSPFRKVKKIKNPNMLKNKTKFKPKSKLGAIKWHSMRSKLKIAIRYFLSKNHGSEVHWQVFGVEMFSKKLGSLHQQSEEKPIPWQITTQRGDSCSCGNTQKIRLQTFPKLTYSNNQTWCFCHD